MKLSALNGFSRVNPQDTKNVTQLEGYHSMNAIPVGMIKRKLERKLKKAKRKAERQSRSEKASASKNVGFNMSPLENLKAERSRKRIAKKMSKFGLNGSINNGFGNSSATVDEMIDLSLQGKKERQKTSNKEEN